jgi:DNA primase
LLWAREIEAAGDLATPERRAGLERRLDEVIRPIADEALRRHYRDELNRRLGLLFGRASGGGPNRPARGRGPAQPSGGAGARGGARGGRFAPMGPRGYLGEPLAVGPDLARSALLRPASAPPREAVIVAALMAHPELVHDRVEELATLDFSGRDSARLLAALLALADEPLDRPALVAALAEVGLDAERVRVEADPALTPIPSIRPEADPGEAVETLEQALWLHRRSVALARELREAEAAFTAEATEAHLAWLNDVKAQLANLEGGAASSEGQDGLFAASPH